MKLKSFLLAAIAANLVLFTGCEKYDDGEIKESIAAIDNRVTALEGKVTTLEGAMAALQTVVDRNYSITGFDKTDNGYELTFTNGETLELLNGEKGDPGDDGDSFLFSITKDEIGNIIITLINGEKFTIPCGVITIGSSDDFLSESISVEKGESTPISITIPSDIDAASVTATLTHSSGIVSDTRSSSVWKVTVAEDKKSVTVVVPENAAEGSTALLQISVVKKDGATYTSSKKLIVFNSLKFTAQEDGSTIKINLDETLYKTSTQNWTAYTANDEITLNNGEFIQFKAAAGSTRTRVRETFTMTGKFAASGSIMSLLGEGQKMGSDAFSELFAHCKSLTAAPELPATELANGCYSFMFSYCEALTEAPELPATKLATECYVHMFSSSGLTAAPALPATTLALRCYDHMFYGCEALTEAPALPATTLTERCYARMFCDCSGLTVAPALPATTLARSCYQEMFKRSGLKAAPALPATTLARSCYQEMFLDCKKLTSTPALPATTLEPECYYRMFLGCSKVSSITVGLTSWTGGRNPTTDWVKGVAATGTFTCPSALVETYGNSNIPTGWTKQNP